MKETDIDNILLLKSGLSDYSTRYIGNIWNVTLLVQKIIYCTIENR